MGRVKFQSDVKIRSLIFIIGRLKPKKRASLKGKKVPVVLICTDLKDREFYRMELEIICLQGFVEIEQDHTEVEIKESLVKVSQKKYPEISIYDFVYVKREKKTISRFRQLMTVLNGTSKESKF